MDRIPFLDLGAMHRELAEQLDRCWENLTTTGEFVGGPAVDEFEASWAAYCERDHAVGTANGTDAIELALRALDIGAGAEVVVPANTFIATCEAVTAVVRAAREHGAALLAVPVRDTLKRADGQQVVDTPDRSEFFAAQTPQVFRVDWLREALAKAESEGRRATDDAALVEALGMPVHLVPGEVENVKITVASDLAAAEAWLARRRPEWAG